LVSCGAQLRPWRVINDADILDKIVRLERAHHLFIVGFAPDPFVAPRMRHREIEVHSDPKPHDFLDNVAVPLMRFTYSLSTIEAPVRFFPRADSYIKRID
jgi:hypothetical protein